MPRQIEYFTASGRSILRLAQNIAIRLQHPEIMPDHILLAMTRARDTNAYHALVDVDVIESKLARYLSLLHPANNEHPLRFEGVDFAEQSEELFRLSMVDATLRGYDYIASTHLLIGMMRLQSDIVDDILEHFSLERKQVIKASEYYFEHSVEVEKHRIPISITDEDNIGCLPAIREALNELTRKRKNDD